MAATAVLSALSAGLFAGVSIGINVLQVPDWLNHKGAVAAVKGMCSPFVCFDVSLICPLCVRLGVQQVSSSFTMSLRRYRRAWPSPPSFWVRSIPLWRRLLLLSLCVVCLQRC
jgi:hypothetical protein